MNVRFEKPPIRELQKEHLLVDMHFHSRYSQDSSTPVQEIVRKARELGVLVALTDHNSINGVLEAHERSPGVIMPAVEITTSEGKDILVYFYTVDELAVFFMSRIQPYVRNTSSLRGGKTGISVERLFKLLENERCVIALAHPFAVGPRRSYRFFSNGHSNLLSQVHGIEVVNQAVPHKRNLAAVGWAMQLEKALVGGSDGHILSMLGSAFTCARATDWEGFLDSLRERQSLVVGEEKKLHHHVTNMSRILREKARVIENRKIRKENS